MSRDVPYVVGHRGAMGVLPENTVGGFQYAIDLGVDYVECDVHLTSDDRLVVMHDATVDRTTDGTGAVSSLSLAELKALDAGYRFSPDGVSYPQRGAGVTVPTLREVLTAFPDQPLIVEIKQTEPPIVEPLLALLRERGAVERTVIASFSADTLEAVRRAEPDSPTGFGLSEVVRYRLTGGPDTPPARYLQVPPRVPGIEVVTPGLLARARSQGVVVQVWTINDADQMRALIELGVSGIMTDDPGLLAGLLPPK